MNPDVLEGADGAKEPDQIDWACTTRGNRGCHYMALGLRYLAKWASLAIWFVFPLSVGGHTFGRADASPERLEISEQGLALTLREGWRQLWLGSDYRGVGAYCDLGIVEIMVERLPFDLEVRTGDLEQQIVADMKSESLGSYGRFRGIGFRKFGRTSEGDCMGYVVFYPDLPACRVAILVIFGEANDGQLLEAKAVVNSLRECTPAQ